MRRSLVVGLSAIALAAVAVPLSAVAQEYFVEPPVVRIHVGDDYQRYDNRELQRRVWELERAVSQLQERVYDLEATPVVVTPPPAPDWTCRVSAFGKTYVKTKASRGEAEALVLKACSDDTHEMHCSNITCSQ